MRIHNTVIDLRWSALENWKLYFLTTFGKNSILNVWEDSDYVSGFKYVRVINIRKFLLICQGSEYVLGCNYGRVLSFPGFQICQVFAYASVAHGSEFTWIWLNKALWQCSEYAWSTFYRVLNKPPVLNVPDSEYSKFVRVSQGGEYVWISMNRYDCQYANTLSMIEYAGIYLKKQCWICQNSECNTVHSIRSLYWTVIEIEAFSEHYQTF